MVEILLPFYPDERTAKKRGRSQKIFTANCNFTAEKVELLLQKKDIEMTVERTETVGK